MTTGRVMSTEVKTSEVVGVGLTEANSSERVSGFTEKLSTVPVKPVPVKIGLPVVVALL